jgi:hypothetical protein
MSVFGSICQPRRKDLLASRNSDWPLGADYFRIRENGQILTLDDPLVHILMHIRLREGAPDPPLISLTSDVATGDYIEIANPPMGVFRPHIRKATLEVLPAANLGQPLAESRVEFVYDLRIGRNNRELRYLYGKFILQTGVTR